MMKSVRIRLVRSETAKFEQRQPARAQAGPQKKITIPLLYPERKVIESGMPDDSGEDSMPNIA